MSEYGLKEAIDEHLPFIDEHLQKLSVPIFDRFIRAAYFFVDVAVIDSSYESKEEILTLQRGTLNFGDSQSQVVGFSAPMKNHGCLNPFGYHLATRGF